MVGGHSGRRDRRAVPTSTPAARALGWCLAAATTAIYLVGSGRAYGLDAAATVHHFVATHSLLDPVREQLVYNNHVLFSFVEHLIYSTTGTADERVLRLFPVLCSGLAVGATATATARRLGLLPGLVAGVTLASSPLLLTNGREVRGYSLFLLAFVASTLALPALAGGARRRRDTVGYALVVAAGVATHLYGLAIVPIHAALIGADRTALRRCLPAGMAGSALGLAAYAGIAATMLNADRGRQFRPEFPATLGQALLGGTWLTAALLLLPVGAGALALRRDPWAVRGAAAAAALVAVTWLAAPSDLYPRFFIWLLPAVAYTVAAGVARHRALAVLVVAAAIVQAVRSAPDFTRSEIASRQAARMSARLHAGRNACAFSLSAFAIEPYDPDVVMVAVTPQPPASCTVIYQLTAGGPTAAVQLPRGWESAFPFRQTLPAVTPGVAFGRHPLPTAAR